MRLPCSRAVSPSRARTQFASARATTASLQIVESLPDVLQRDALAVALLEGVPVRRVAVENAVGRRELRELEAGRRRLDERVAIARRPRTGVGLRVQAASRPLVHLLQIVV